VPGWPGARELRRLARPAADANGASACAVAAGDDAGGWPTGPTKTANPFRVHPDTGGT